MKPPVRGVVLLFQLILVFCLVASTGRSDAIVGAVLGVDIAFETSAPYYRPQQAIVPANKPVRWVNSTASPHSVRHDGCLTEDRCAFQSIAVPPDSSYEIAPLPPGRYSYHCELHPIMRGTLIVIEPSTRYEEDSSQSELIR